MPPVDSMCQSHLFTSLGPMLQVWGLKGGSHIWARWKPRIYSIMKSRYVQILIAWNKASFWMLCCLLAAETKLNRSFLEYASLRAPLHCCTGMYQISKNRCAAPTWPTEKYYTTEILVSTATWKQGWSHPGRENVSNHSLKVLCLLRFSRLMSCMYLRFLCMVLPKTTSLEG